MSLPSQHQQSAAVQNDCGKCSVKTSCDNARDPAYCIRLLKECQQAGCQQGSSPSTGSHIGNAYPKKK